MTTSDASGTLPTTTFNAKAVTHRLIRHARRETVATVIHEGSESTKDTTVSYEAVCACGHVFQADTDQGASAKYLNHLPKPTGQRG